MGIAAITNCFHQMPSSYQTQSLTIRLLERNSTTEFSLTMDFMFQHLTMDFTFQHWFDNFRPPFWGSVGSQDTSVSKESLGLFSFDDSDEDVLKDDYVAE